VARPSCYPHGASASSAGCAAETNLALAWQEAAKVKEMGTVHDGQLLLQLLLVASRDEGFCFAIGASVAHNIASG
jgi:hypothetical protein